MQENDTISTVEIPLYSRAGDVVGFTIVDAADADLVNQNTWRLASCGYARRSIRDQGRKIDIWLHHVILGLPNDLGHIINGDHKDRNRLNNSRSNLRITSKIENRQNLPSYSGSVSRFRGVTYDSRKGLWRARVQLRGKVFHLGYFDTEEDAGIKASEVRRAIMPFAVED